MALQFSQLPTAPQLPDQCVDAAGAMIPGHTSNNVVTDLSRLQISKFLNVAALAVFVFDYCLTFSTEVEYVWPMKWRAGRIVFTISRYLPFISSSLTCYDVLANPKCGGLILALDAVYIVSIIFAEGVLILRTYAMWGRSRRILIFLLSLAAALIVCAEVLSQLVNISLPGDATSLYKICSLFRTPRNPGIQYALLMVFEIILQSMNTWRKFRAYRHVRIRLLNTLYWGGVMYMSWIVVLSAANMAIQMVAPVAYALALDTAQVAIHSVLASRIFFNLRQCDQQICSFGEVFSLESLHFQTRPTTDATTQSDRVVIA